MKIGVVICTCGNTLDLDFESLKSYVENLVDRVEVVDLLCKNLNLESFRGFDGVIFAF
jgi:heterodisulfide reductase subunit A-like polyferredoxin